MVDYLSRENGLPLCRNYNDICMYKPAEPLFPLSAIVADTSIRDAIPEFIRFNIVESEVRNVI